MRRLRAVFVSALLVFGLASPAVAARDAYPSAWSWREVTQRVVEWVQGARNLLAPSEASDPATTADTAGTDSADLDGPGDATSTDDPTTQTEAFPGYDPDG